MAIANYLAALPVHRLKQITRREKGTGLTFPSLASRLRIAAQVGQKRPSSREEKSRALSKV